jgi:hypothetical protein
MQTVSCWLFSTGLSYNPIVGLMGFVVIRVAFRDFSLSTSVFPEAVTN